jgi:hypothetical protein
MLLSTGDVSLTSVMVAIRIEAQARIDHFRKTDCTHSYRNVEYIHLSNTFLNLNEISGGQQSVSVTSEGSLFFLVLSRLLHKN